MADYVGVGCEGVREALSARLDGEPAPIEPAVIDAHLAGCADCRRWFDDAAVVTRLARTGPALAGVDVTEAVLPAAPGRWRGRLAIGLRVALGALGAVQVLLGLLQVIALHPGEGVDGHGTTVDGATAGHLWHESAAWNVAVGAAFLWVAGRRGRPVGIVPILTVFLGVLVLLSAADMLAGQVEATRLASHAFVLAGYLIVVALSRAPLEAAPPGQRVGVNRERFAGESPPDGVIPFPGRGRNQPAARTGRHEAA